MPMIVAPIAGALTDRIGGKPFLVAGLALQAIALAWMAAVLSPTVPYTDVVAPFALAGIGMGLFFAPVATLIMSSVRLVEAGQASGANNAIRELGGVFGVAVLASIFAHQGGYGSAGLFTDGILPALWVGSGVVAVGFVAALLLPGRAARAAGRAGETELEPVTV
jgi:MFS family permease